MSHYKSALFIFRRDLRIDDNSALNKALFCSEKVLPCFIFDPRQIDKHPYQSKFALAFMQQSLTELQEAFKSRESRLSLFADFPVQIIKKLVQQHKIEAVFVNRDYTPFSLMRDKEMAEVCKSLQLDFHVVPDYLLVEPEQALKSNSSPYRVFTPFYNNARQFSIPLPKPLEKVSFIQSKDGEEDVQAFLPQIDLNIKAGGRNQALAILNGLNKQAHYQSQRDYPALDATSRLSAHLKFGTCSVREAYYAIVQHLGAEHPLLRQLYWRDFFTHIAFHYPHVFGKVFYPRFDHLIWDNNRDFFDRWAEGKTGFPIVDAGMRELNTTGFMHNRVRMIVASFLTKDLHIDWRWGERYFAQHLVDYDPSVNNGNWQWAASTGCDAQPYFRIFNPWLQQQKFDPDCRYIYQWLPELKDISPTVIHAWNSKHLPGSYPEPIVDHALESNIAKERYAKIAA
jgi:deoxyribodipyrimidine photo-lyase